MSLLPDVYPTHGVALTRRQSRELAQQMAAEAAELHGIAHAELAERARMQALGGVAEEAVDAVGRLGYKVALCAESNPFGAHLAARFATQAEHVFERQFERASRRLG